MSWLGNNTKILICSFIVAIIIWCILNISSFHLVTIKIPFTINGKSTSSKYNHSENELTFTIKGKGLEIISFYYYNKLIELPLNDIDEIIKSQSLQGTKIRIPGNLQVVSISSSHSVKNTNPAKGVTLTLPVKLEFQNLKALMKYRSNRYYITKPNIPIIVPKDFTIRISNIKSVPISLHDLEKNSFYVHLILPSNTSFPQTDSVEIRRISYQKSTRTFINVPIMYHSYLQVYPSAVSLKVKGDFDKINSLTKHDIHAKLSETHGDNDNAQVVIELPSGIELIDYTPAFVKVKLKNE